MEQSKVSHLKNTKRILKYLTTTIKDLKVFVKGTMDYGVLLHNMKIRRTMR